MSKGLGNWHEPTIITYDAPPDRLPPHDARWYLRTFAAYFIAPVVAAAAVVLVALVEAYPAPTIVAVMIVAALVKPAFDMFWRSSKAEPNDGPCGDGKIC